MTHPTAILTGLCKLDPTTFIGPYCVLGFPSQSEESYLRQWSESDPAFSVGASIGNGTVLLSHVVVGEGTEIGSHVWCDHHTYIGCSSVIGNNVSIMYGARIYDRVKIGKNVWIGGFICNDTIVEDDAVVLGQIIHRFVDADESIREPSPIIRSGAFIGMGATIIGNVEIGSEAYIAAGAVLTKSAQAGLLYKGVPAKVAGKAPKAFKNKRIGGLNQC